MASIVLPPEWIEQDAVQLTWPHADSDWNYMLEEITSCFVQIAHEILKQQKLLIVCADVDAVKSALGDVDENKLILQQIPSNDTWARDHSAISVFIDNKPCLYDFTFNGWGLKFAADLDNQINKSLYASKSFFGSEVNCYNKKDFVLEGGSVESDGKGTLLTTSECLLSPNRNSFLPKEEVELYLKNTFGLNRVLWLDYGCLAGDDTDSHIDTLARFCDERTIAYVKCYNIEDEHYDSLEKMEKQLMSFLDFQGRPYDLIPLPLPKAIYDDEGKRLPATYANFLIMNETVLLPVYNDNEHNNSLAINAITKAFPSRKVVPVNCSSIIKQHGSLHCVTMQFPKGFVNIK